MYYLVESENSVRLLYARVTVLKSNHKEYDLGCYLTASVRSLSLYTLNSSTRQGINLTFQFCITIKTHVLRI